MFDTLQERTRGVEGDRPDRDMKGTEARSRHGDKHV